MKKIILNMAITITTTLFMFLAFQQATSKAATTSFQNVVPFVNNMGFIGFFDQNTGMIYLYDGDLKNCVLTTQVTKLGEPTSEIKAFVPPQKESLKYYIE